MRPFRCTHCSHRFFTARTALVEPRKWAFAGTIALIATALAGIALTIGIDGYEAATGDGPSVEPRAPLAAEILKAAQEGNVDAQFRVGKNLLYSALSENGKPTTEALQWMQRAAENGSTEAMVYLGRLYRTGVGALQNYRLSGEWTERAANSGDAEGMLELGRLYRDGIGFEHDPVHAYVWFNRAAAALNMDAVFERNALARRLTPEQLKAAQDLSTAVRLEPALPDIEQTD